MISSIRLPVKLLAILLVFNMFALAETVKVPGDVYGGAIVLNDGSIVFTGTDGMVHVVSKDGEIVNKVFPLQVGAPIVSAPAVVDSGGSQYLLVKDIAGNLTKVNLKTGKIEYQVQIKGGADLSKKIDVARISATESVAVIGDKLVAVSTGRVMDQFPALKLKYVPEMGEEGALVGISLSLTGETYLVAKDLSNGAVKQIYKGSKIWDYAFEDVDGDGYKEMLIVDSDNMVIKKDDSVVKSLKLDDEVPVQQIVLYDSDGDGKKEIGVVGVKAVKVNKGVSYITNVAVYDTTGRKMLGFSQSGMPVGVNRIRKGGKEEFLVGIYSPKSQKSLIYRVSNSSAQIMKTYEGRLGSFDVVKVNGKTKLITFVVPSGEVKTEVCETDVNFDVGTDVVPISMGCSIERK